MCKLIKTGFIIATICFISIIVAAPVGQNEDLKKVFERTDSLEKKGAYRAAHLLNDSMIKVAIEHNDKLTEAFFTQLESKLYLLSHQYDSGLIYAIKAKELAYLIQNDSIYGLALLCSAKLYRHTLEMDSAYNNYNKALVIFEELQDSVNIAETLVGLTLYYKYITDYRKGIVTGLRSTYIYKKLNKTNSYLAALNGLANIYQRLRYYDTALSIYSSVYNVSLEKDLPKLNATAKVNMAVIYFYQKKYDESKKLFLEAIEFNNSIHDRYELSLLYDNLSLIYKAEGDNNKRLEALEKSYSYAKEIDNATRMMTATNKLGVFYKDSGAFLQAAGYYQMSLKIALRASNKHYIKLASTNLANLFSKMGNYSESIKYYKLSLAYQDSLFNETYAKLIQKALADNKVLVLDDMIKEINSTHIQEVKGLESQAINLKLTIIFIVFALSGILLFFRMRAKKNRIIATQRIKQLEDENKLISAQAVLLGQEQERKRIAQDLHDGIGVLLSTASIQFSKIKSDSEKHRSDDMFSKAMDLLNNAGGELRKISRNMMPGVLSKLGLRDAIEDLFDSLTEADNIETQLEINCTNKRLPENMEIMLYRIIQELVNNTLKHANARRISFRIDRDAEIIKIFYSDDGIGFDSTRIDIRKGMGLSGIKSRVDFLNGKLSLQTGKGKGTRYEIEIPLSA